MPATANRPVVVIDAHADERFDRDDGGRWITYCLTHDEFIQHATRADARAWADDPATWCEGCQGRPANPPRPYMRYDHPHAVAFTWGGGAYIHVAYYDGNDYRADVADPINVWDYEADRPRIPLTLAAFQAECDEWIAAALDEC